MSVIKVLSIKGCLPEHPMTFVFSLKLGIEMHLPSDEDVVNLDKLLELFPQSPYLLTQKAQLCFQQKGE